jgi:prenyltransferase beta subunit
MNPRVKLVALFLATVLILSLTSAALAGPGDDAASKALAWLATKQNADGGFSDGFSPESKVSATADAILAIASAGQDVSVWKKNGISPLDYLQSRAGQLSKGGELGKVILAVIATGGDPHSFGSVDLVARLNALHKSGGYGGTLYEDTLAVLALANAGQSVPDDVLTRLLNAQTTDGAWAFTGETAAGAGDTNTTALVVQALIAVGKRDSVGRALDYLRRTQNADAGWPYQVPSAYGTETDANSTANVLQALVAAGESLSNWSKAGQSDPLGALIRLQDDKTGAFNYQASAPGANLLATIQAIPALKSTTFVRVPVTRPSSTAAVATVPPPQMLPVAGGALPLVAPGLVAIGGLCACGGLLMRRR